ncbi:MAG: hypothetical protein ACFNVM_07145, partial [Neisseria elongata]
VTHCANFNALYAATGDTIPPKGKFLVWMEQGGAVLYNALSDQKVQIDTINGTKWAFPISTTQAKSQIWGICAKRCAWRLK